MTSFQNLTQKLLSKVFGNLTYAEISQLRGKSLTMIDNLIQSTGVSINLHQVARQHLNSAFLELGPQLITRYTQYLILLKTDNISRVSGDVIFQGRLLRLLGSEHAILLALCRNYITNGKGCFTPGEILDLFIELQRDDLPTGMQHEENKKLARLVLLTDQYLDWFEKFRITSEEHCSWYGTCIVDLLDSYLSPSYNLVATHDGPLVKLSGRYAIKCQSEIPPKISEPLGGPITFKELLQVLRYIRKHVRWSNFVTSFRNETENFVEFEEDTEEIITDNKQGCYQRTYKRNQSDFRDHDDDTESLIVMVNLQCDRCYGPARLRGGFEEMNEWRKEIEVLKRGMKERQPSLAKDLSIISKTYTMSSFKSKLTQLKLMRESARIDDNSKPPMYDKYVFNLEIKAIYPSKNPDSGETFGETMLHVSHTPEHIFAAQNECSLY